MGILLDGLRSHGVDVQEVNRPLGFSTAERVDMLRRPWLAVGLVGRLLARWALLSPRARRLARQGRFDAVLVGYMGHFDVVLARVLFPRTRIVLDQLIFAADTALDRRVEPGLKLRLLRALDRLATTCADVVLVDTAEQLDLLAPTARHKGAVVPVGAPTSWFDSARRESSIPAGGPIRAVFFGLFTPLQGTVTIGDAIGLLADEPGIEFTMVGSGQDLNGARGRAAPNARVEWVDWIDPHDLPSTVADHDICLGIFGTSPKALRVVPNKAYQGAAARLAIVTSDTEPQRRALGDAAVFVAPGNPRALADSLRRLAADAGLVGTLQGRARRIAEDQFTPPAVAAILLSVLGYGP